ncbi:hypothetical protein ACQEVM_19665 [Streptomyces sp. CA-243310]|uniref:hypothetical protein n=1 Tax=Streptomyces sp. CA-243310 TaxID=3240056 RepID=UPI003D8B9D5D
MAGARPPRPAPRPWAVAGDDLAAQFHIGRSVPGAWHSWDTSGDEAPVRLWLADTDGPSWACVDWDGERSDAFSTRQFGARDLWDEMEQAHAWWTAAGHPEIERYRMPVTADGAHSPWLDTPETVVPITYVREGREHRG